MQKYDENDEVTLYFIIFKDRLETRICAWSDNKDYAKVYMEFHKCKNMEIRSRTDVFKRLIPILEENIHDEIQFMNLNVRNPNKNKKHKTTNIMVPMTETESDLLNYELNTKMSSVIDYNLINRMFYYLKDKYQKALKGILLKPMMEYVVHNKRNELLLDIDLDELMVFAKLTIDSFGE